MSFVPLVLHRECVLAVLHSFVSQLNCISAILQYAKRNHAACDDVLWLLYVAAVVVVVVC